jgi:hypothetical protein
LCSTAKRGHLHALRTAQQSQAHDVRVGAGSTKLKLRAQRTATRLIRLQHGFATRSLGLFDHFAKQQFATANVCMGSFASIPRTSAYVRFTPDSDRIADIVGRQKCARSCREQVQQKSALEGPPHSIILSARGEQCDREGEVAEIVFFAQHILKN